MRAQIVAVGLDAAARDAGCTVLAAIASRAQSAVVVVEHPSPERAGSLVAELRARSSVPVVEITDKEPVTVGRILVAPPDYHVLVERGSLALSVDSPVGGFRPSMEALFESVAIAYGPAAVGVVVGATYRSEFRALRRIADAGGVALCHLADGPPRAHDGIGGWMTLLELTETLGGEPTEVS
jgi:two-component system, chemotaxis family, protein-glutamate methylesterase/glutaminase